MSALNSHSFKATHNSYSGNIGGKRGSIEEQLNGGVRLIELDLHTDDFQSLGDYQIGHSSPGDQVFHDDGNPQSNLFADWTAIIAAWSQRNSGHAPIQLVLDIKNSLSLPSAAVGNHGALNTALQNAFGPLLLISANVNEWPPTESLQGRVLVVLSGDQGSRVAYGIDQGINPSASVNSLGQVVEVHESNQGNNTLWYWVGQMAPNGMVTWLRHGRYGTGTTPAVAINDAGFVVEVHKSENNDRLWSQVGRLTGDMDIAWQGSHDYDNGKSPTIRFASSTSNILREIHESQAHSQNWQWSVALDAGNSTLNFSSNAKTSDPRFLSNQANGISVSVDDGDVLLFNTPFVDRGLICYQQIAFVELQDGDPASIQSRARFAAAAASSTDFLAEKRLAGLLTRGWQFSSDSPILTPPENYLATDTPFAKWYTDFCLAIGTIF